MENVFNVTAKGEYHWELIFDIDNTKNTGTITREVEVVTDVSLSYENMVRELESNKTSKTTGLNLGGTLFEILNVSVKGELNNEVKSEYEKMTRTKQDYRKTTKKRDVYEVGPNSSLKLYRLVFSGPGVSYVTDTLSSTTSAMPFVPIEIKGKTISVLQDIQVVHTDDSASRPSDLIQEAHGLNPDINAGFGGKYVWLRAIWTKELSKGATGIQIVVQQERNNSYVDMAAGAKGEYRYVKMLRDPNSTQRITEIALWRDPASATLPTASGKYQFSTQDINQRRKKDYLYLCWNGKLV